MPNHRSIVLVAHNLRSAHNVGSILRTADGLSVDKVWLTGYTPYPFDKNDSRLPHLAQKIDRQIDKTALGAQGSVDWSHAADIGSVIDRLKAAGYSVAALEQAPAALQLPGYSPPQQLAIIVGREAEGIELEVLALCDQVIEIPMSGTKESFNVSVATAMALYHCRYAA